MTGLSDKELTLYKFSKEHTDGSIGMVDVLGGKGANLAEMASMKLPVPPGFTIPTETTKWYYSSPKETLGKVMPKVIGHVDWLTQEFGYEPLLSVRSGSPVSMPGMMDTVLNVGMSDSTLATWEDRIGVWAARDSYRRLIQMLGTTRYEIPEEEFSKALQHVKDGCAVTEDKDLSDQGMSTVIKCFKAVFKSNTGKQFPQGLHQQLSEAIGSVYLSWNSPRAVHYRKMNNIPDDIGTAVTVQSMVFGNMNNNSGSGVVFTRNPQTGVNEFMGEFLPNAQGEDVVAGIRTPLPLESMSSMWPEVYSGLVLYMKTLEDHHKDMQDIEFTVQDGELYILQARVGKRTAQAALRIAHELWEGGIIKGEEYLRRVTPQQYLVLSRPQISPAFKLKEDMSGIPACNGVAVGRAVFTVEEALQASEPVILIATETTPNDIKAMDVCVGIITATGGATSHAAVVARAMDTPCVTGISGLSVVPSTSTAVYVDEKGNKLTISGPTTVSICGDTGRVWVCEVPVVKPDTNEYLETLNTMIKCKSDAWEVSDTLGVGEAQVIALSEFWGDLDKVEKILTDLKGYTTTTRSKIAIDTTRPKNMRLPVDDVLWGVFGTYEELEKDFDDEFLSNVYKTLKTNADALEGLVLLGEPVPKGLKGKFLIGEEPSTLGDLLSMSRVKITEDFVTNTLGGWDVFKKLEDKFGEFKKIPPHKTKMQMMFEVLKSN